MFEVLVYTDCSAEESVSGRTGFQFQAESDGATPTDESVVLSDLQHVVATNFPVDQPESQPPSCSYVARGGRYYLSRGISTGNTLSGRPGNQLTETIVTEERADILPRRPAQLYAASNWTLRRAPGKEIQGWQSPLEIGPDFEVAGLHSLAVSDPWALSVLPTFLTMVELATASPRVKLIIKHADQATVMKWVALAQFVMDSDTALQSTFRVFSPNPVADSANIVGAHPELSPEISVSSVVGQNVLDLVERTATNVSISPSAQRHARWFIGSDPYSALDAIEVSRRWAGVMDPDTASAAAEIACLGRAMAVEQPQYRTATSALNALAGSEEFEELEAYGEPLADVVADYLTGSAIDFEPAVTALWALNAAGEGMLVSHLALAMLERACSSHEYAQKWALFNIALPSADTLRVAWPDEESRTFAGTLTTSMIQRAPLDNLPALFSLVKCLNVDEGASGVQARISELALRWVFRPELTSRAYMWAHREFVIQDMMGHLADQLSRQNSRVIASLTAGDWDWLLNDQWVFDPHNPLATWLASRDLARTTVEDRRRKFEAYSPHAPVWAWPLFVAQGGPAERSELATWVRDHPALDEPLSLHIDQLIRADLERGTTRETGHLLRQVCDQGVTGLSPALAELEQYQLYIESQWDFVVRDIAQPFNRGLRQLLDCPKEWLEMHEDSVATSVIYAADRDGAVALGKAGHVGSAVGKILEELLAKGDVNALIGALTLISEQDVDFRSAAKRSLDTFWDERDSHVRDALKQGLPQRWMAELDAYEHAQSRGRVGRELTRGARSLFGRKD